MNKNVVKGVAMLVMSSGIICACHEGHRHGDENEKAHSADGHGHGNEIIFEAAKAREAGVEVAPVVRGPFRRTLKVGGRLSSATGEEVTVVATVPGVVAFPARGLSEGMAVRKGESVVNITSGNVLDGESVARAKEEWETAFRELKRLEQLAAEQLVTRSELEDARLRCSTARMAYDGVASYVSGGKVGVPAPIGGFVKQSLVTEGDYVTVGQPLAVLTQVHKLQLKAEVGETDLDFLHEVDNALFRTSADTCVYDVRSMDGRLLSVGQAVASESFYVPVTFEFNNVGRLYPGSYAEVWLQGAVMDSVLTLPLSSLTESQGVYYVYVREDEDCYEKREVKSGASDGRRFVVLDGLQEGEQVVVRGVIQVKLAASAGLIPEGHNHNH